MADPVELQRADEIVDKLHTQRRACADTKEKALAEADQYAWQFTGLQRLFLGGTIEKTVQEKKLRAEQAAGACQFLAEAEVRCEVLGLVLANQIQRERDAQELAVQANVILDLSKENSSLVHENISLGEDRKELGCQVSQLRDELAFAKGIPAPSDRVSTQWRKFCFERARKMWERK